MLKDEKILFTTNNFLRPKHSKLSIKSPILDQYARYTDPVRQIADGQ